MGASCRERSLSGWSFQGRIKYKHVKFFPFLLPFGWILVFITKPWLKLHSSTPRSCFDHTSAFIMPLVQLSPSTNLKDDNFKTWLRSCYLSAADFSRFLIHAKKKKKKNPVPNYCRWIKHALFLDVLDRSPSSAWAIVIISSKSQQRAWAPWPSVALKPPSALKKTRLKWAWIGNYE